MLNLWDPQHLSVGIGLLTALLLGMLHGITPDEHTWPITFSYAIGSYSTRGGLKAGLLFSLGFTLQRAIGSQLAFFALAGFLFHVVNDNIVYIVVGLVMALSGYLILHRAHALHLVPWLERWLPFKGKDGGAVPLRLAFLHGVIAGWGTGAFALILYTVIAPAMPTAWMGFMPGLLFGFGTMLMQAGIGAVFGWWVQRRKVDLDGKRFIGRYVAGNTLLYGGLLFGLAGSAGLLLPSLSDWGISTGIRIHNLDSINVGLLLVMAVVGVVGGVSLVRAFSIAKRDTSSAAL